MIVFNFQKGQFFDGIPLRQPSAKKNLDLWPQASQPWMVLQVWEIAAFWGKKKTQNTNFFIDISGWLGVQRKIECQGLLSCYHPMEKNGLISTMVFILVGGWATPLKNMKVNWDDEIPNIWENKIHGNQTTNQLLIGGGSPQHPQLVKKFPMTSMLPPRASQGMAIIAVDQLPYKDVYW